MATSYVSRPILFSDTGEKFLIFEPLHVDDKTGELDGGKFRDPDYYLSKYPGRILQIVKRRDYKRKKTFVAIIESIQDDQQMVRFKQAHDTEVKRVLEAAGVDENVIYDAFHNASIVGRNAANGVSS